MTGDIDNTCIEEAVCACCGYSLRKLPIPRCPECGQVFDPSLHAQPAAPRWPTLLICVLLAWFGEAAVDAFGVAHYWDVRFNESNWGWYVAFRVNDAKTVLTLLLAPPAVAGPWLGRRWGGLGALALCCSVAAACTAGILLGSADGSQGPEGLIAASMALLIVPKLKQGRDIRRVEAGPRRLLQSTSAVRRDWVPLLMILVMTGPLNCWTVALSALLSKSLPWQDWEQAWSRARGLSSSLNMLDIMLHYVQLWALLVVGLLGMICVWLWPRSARWVTTVLFITWLIPSLLGMTRRVLSFYESGHPAGIGLAYEICLCLQRIMMPLALMIFALLCVPRPRGSSLSIT